MNKRIVVSYDLFMYILICALFIGNIVFQMVLWRSIFVYVVLCAIAFFTILSGRLKLSVNPYLILMFLLGMFSYISAIWAIDRQDSFRMGNGITFIWFFSIFLFAYYKDNSDMKTFLSILKASGYFIAIYVILRYGFNGLRQASISADLRLSNDFANVNSIAMIVAYACMVTFYEIIYENKKNIIDLFLIPSFIVLAALQSRKALILILVGIIVPLFLKNLNNKNNMKGLVKILVGIIVLIVIIIIASNLPMFNGITERMVELINNYRGIRSNGYIPIRERLIDLGIKAWKEKPLCGYGMANAHILASKEYNFDAYLHNNYFELLVGGGLIAFALYYAIYLYLLISLIKYRKGNKKQVVMGYMFLFATILMDWGQVSYYCKPDCYILIFQVINVQCLAKNYYYGQTFQNYSD